MFASVDLQWQQRKGNSGPEHLPSASGCPIHPSQPSLLVLQRQYLHEGGDPWLSNARWWVCMEKEDKLIICAAEKNQNDSNLSDISPMLNMQQTYLYEWMPTTDISKDWQRLNDSGCFHCLAVILGSWCHLEPESLQQRLGIELLSIYLSTEFRIHPHITVKHRPVNHDQKYLTPENASNSMTKTASDRTIFGKWYLLMAAMWPPILHFVFNAVLFSVWTPT